MAIELPRDANGQIIPLDTTMMYRENGNQFHVADLFFEARPGRWLARSGIECIETNKLYLDPFEKDSWEKLEEDLDRCIEESNLCMYYNQNLDCNNCIISGNESRGCTSIALEDIKKRIRMLRGED